MLLFVKFFKVWDVKTVVTGNGDSQVRFLRQLEGHKFTVWALVVSEDGKYVFSGSSDGTIMVQRWRNARIFLILSIRFGKLTHLNVSKYWPVIVVRFTLWSSKEISYSALERIELSG